MWPADNPRYRFVDDDAKSGILEKTRGIPSPYPLTTLVVVAPLTLLSWSVAIRLWFLVNLIGVLAAPFALLSICDYSALAPRGLLFLGTAFALAPWQTGLATANPALLAVSLTVAAVWAERRSSQWTAGTLLSLALCLKPTVAGGLLLYYFARRKWKVAFIASAVTAAVGAVGVCRLAMSGTPWLSSYLENSRRIFAPGSLDDFSRANPLRFDLINAQVPLYAIFKSTSAANATALLVGAMMIACWIWFCYFDRPTNDLLEISGLSVVSLIPVYHRFYDAALLIWPLALSLLSTKRSSATVLIFATIVPFLAPGATLLDQGSPFLRTGWLWDVIIMPHQAWDLLLLAIFLLYYKARDYREAQLGV